MALKTYKLYNINKQLSREKLTYQFNVLMVQKGLNQKRLAHKVGITQQLMSHIIRGARSGKVYRQKICQVLGTSEKEIWNDN